MFNLKKLLLAASIAASIAAALLPNGASAQSNPGLTRGQVLTAGQWNNLFAGKQDTLGYTPVNSAGGIMTGRLVTAPPGASTAGFNLTPGSTPASPVNGDMWVTSAGVFVRINGSTVGPLASAAGGSFAATSPITVGFGGGTTTYACPTCVVTTGNISQIGSSTSAQLLGILSDETGSGLAVFNTGPTLAGVTITTSFSAAGLVGLTNLASQSANTLVANFTGSPAVPVAVAVPSCVGSAAALQYVSGSGITCAAIVAAAGSIAVGTTSITSGTIGNVFYHAASNLLGEMTTTGTGTTLALSAGPTFTGTITAAAATFSGNVNFTSTFQISGTTQTFPASGLLVGTTDTQTLSGKTLTNPTMTTPVLGAATGTSLALGGCTIGANAFCATGSAAISSTLTSAAHAITSASASALVVGLNGATNPALKVDASTATSATGLQIKSAAAAGGLAVSVITSGTNENMTIDAAGSGTISFGNTSTGAIIHTRATTLSAALTYGGVTFNNVVTGSGNLVGSVSPTFTGTITAAAVNFSGAVSIASASASAFAAGLNGATNPAFLVDASTGSQAAGLKITGAVTGGTVAIAAIDSGTNANVTINAKGNGTIGIGSVSTGPVTITPAVTHSGATTMSAAITYGGVTWANSVTGTGSPVLSISPTITGHMTVEGVTATGATGTGNFVFGTNPSVSNLTVTTAFTATGLVGYGAIATAALATNANYFAGASSVLVPADKIYQAEITITFGTTQAIDVTTFINGAITLTANTTTQTLTAQAGKAGMVRFIQDGTGGRTTVWDTKFKFPGGTAPTLSTAPGAVDDLAFGCVSTTYCVATLIKDVR